MDDPSARDAGPQAGTIPEHVPRPPQAKTGAAQAPAVCPFCGFGRTELISLFGSTSLTSQHYCRECRSVFERVKWGGLSDP
jgi:hypothetical protein